MLADGTRGQYLVGPLSAILELLTFPLGRCYGLANSTLPGDAIEYRVTRIIILLSCLDSHVSYRVRRMLCAVLRPVWCGP